jgi:phage shock protein A
MTMNLFTKMWRYLGTALGMKFEELADPKVQIEQAIEAAQRRATSLRGTAASVIANQKSTQAKLDQAITDLDAARAKAKQALVMAEEATVAGDEARAGKMLTAAEAFANQIVVLEQEVATLENLLLQAATAAEQAKQAVTQNQVDLQRQLSERQALLNKLGQAEVAEKMVDAMEAMDATVGSDVPSLEQVRSKIDDRLARAQGKAEVSGWSVKGQMREVEQAAMAGEAQARLSELRSELGITTRTEQATPNADAIEAEIEAAVRAAAEHRDDRPAPA